MGMVKILYFSPSGNVKYLAQKLHKQINTSSLHPMEFTKYTDLVEAEHIIIMFSIHGFNAPRTVKRYIKHFPKGLSPNISFIAVGCAELWINSAATLSLKKQLTERGYHIKQDIQLAMPLTLVTPFPDSMAIEVIEGAEKCLEDFVTHMDTETYKVVPLKSKVLNLIGKMEDPAARLFGLELYANKSCTSCGLCIRECPENNIKMGKRDKPKFGFNCMMCLRCIYRCPEKAISPRFSRFIPIKDGYNINKIVKNKL